jgi:hypothetical protein
VGDLPQTAGFPHGDFLGIARISHPFPFSTVVKSNLIIQGITCVKTASFMNYMLNCMLLLLPIAAWNVIFASKLPQAYLAAVFEKDISPLITGGENIFRLLVFILPLLMPLRIETQSQKIGLWLYIVGTGIYFVSWLAQMYFPQSPWSLSAFGFLAPAYTPLIWLIGIGLIGSSLYFSSPYHSWMYILMSTIFIGFHLSHALTVYLRNLQ